MKQLGTVAYRAAPDALAAQPPLRRFAGPWSLWALGVSVVITGEFSGWNTGLTVGGFGGLLIATIVITVMYLALAFSLAEMSAAMPFTGGAYGFARAALGPHGACVAGLAQVIEYVLSAAAVGVVLGSYIDAYVASITGIDLPDPVFWGLLYVLFVGLNIHGAATTFRVAIVLAILALAALAVFWVLALPAFDIDLALDVPVKPGGTTWLPNGLIGIAWAIPFAMWFYLAIEAVPLAAEESARPQHGVPRGLAWGVGTLVVAALLTLVLNSAVPPGAAKIGATNEPLLAGLSGILGGQINTGLLVLIGIAGQAGSFHAMIYAYGRSIFAMARAGYLPPALATVHQGRRTPHLALMLGGAVGLAVTLIAKLAPQGVPLEAMLISMSAFAAIISYILQMLAFTRLRRRYADLPRPYVSPLGATGAVTALVIAMAALLFMFLDPTLRAGMFGCAAVIAAGLAYFLLFARHRLIRSPEEIFALAQSGHERDALDFKGEAAAAAAPARSEVRAHG